MSKINKDNLGYLGKDFQYRLIQQIIVDPKFGESIIDILKPNYFDDSFLRALSSEIVNNYDEYGTIPDINNLESIILSTANDDIDKKMYEDHLDMVKNANLNNGLRTQDTAMKFCKQQELKKSVVEIQKIIDKGDLEDYIKCEEILKKALEVGENKDSGIDVFEDIESVLEDDFRDPIATGINGLDSYMDGGLSKTELGVILAPFGVGKTTMMTKLGNHAKNIGKNVVQIFFEDNPKVIQKKHLACWVNLEEDVDLTLNELNENTEEVFRIKDKRYGQPGKIQLKKFPSDGTTIPHIKQYIKKLISQGFIPDVVLLDYIDCVQSTKQYKESWDAEGNVMRQFETMLSEMNLAGWTAVQGNRSSIGADKVDSTMIGGSIKKGQIGHFIVSIAKTLEQKESGHATMAILKSRFGKDGIIFEDIVFDNGRIKIDMTEGGEQGKTFLQTDEMNKKREVERANSLRIAMLNRTVGEVENNNNNNN